MKIKTFHFIQEIRYFFNLLINYSIFLYKTKVYSNFQIIKKTQTMKNYSVALHFDNLISNYYYNYIICYIIANLKINFHQF